MAQQAPSTRAHAKLSASGSKRWLSCPGSVSLEQMFSNVDSSSTHSDEGTFAHELSELHLALWAGHITKEQHVERLAAVQTNGFYSQEMEDYIQTYIDVVIERINTARAKTPDATVLFEERLDFSPWVPEGFGTGDVVIIADGSLEVIDLKYGKGVPVSAIGNPQLRLYGLGAINGFGFLYDIHSVRMTIVQPRLDDISTEELSADELLEWADKTVKPGAKLALSGKGKTVAGEHCKFCKARSQCRARAEMNLKLMEYEFREARLLSIEELADIRGKIDDLASWASDVKDHMLEQAEKNGVKYPGWKLVEGKSNRVYSSKEAVESKLLEQDGYAALIYEPKSILGITAMEKAIGKKKFTELLGELVVKPTGKPTLVEESDKRPELNSLASIDSDFGGEEFEDSQSAVDIGS
ncbi:uncharacterized protein DUF2800 [Paenibacillus cellulosilyticus]|uniref:Uncharacterized protein DUF2800 n=1 Tax=Paenibacillus cellulosilyticus TaxID=375489 RepID=A0A2V2YGJ6_9BACL|nr:DUF2800 domain-containing protein [Paenibacillus cellulosilyticus]PWV90228.1 uncharacterized protein DUF2800 [Paenibacillus cellulosilyticus]QKS43388.1 DUF2800 domain-containing protein [Paenibacillus cellulosilyticus]